MSEKKSAIFDKIQVKPWSFVHQILTEFDVNENRHVNHILDPGGGEGFIYFESNTKITK